jgi:hypothetical protein
VSEFVEITLEEIGKELYNQVKEHGVVEERERIIKLLEDNLGHMDWDDLKKLIEGE